MNRVSYGVAALLVIGGCTGSDSDGAPESDRLVTYFEGGSVILGDGSDPIENAALVVNEGVITAVGPMAEVAHPAGAERYDFSGHTIIPFLHNTHGHVGYVRGTDFSAGNYTAEGVREDLERYVYWGVGSVASLGLDTGDTAFLIREAQRSGPAKEARLFTAGRGITATNGFPSVGVAALEGVPYEVGTEEAARATVRDLVEQGVDFIKIWVDDNRRATNQVYRAGRLENVYASSPRLSPALYRAIIEEAHAGGTRVVAHVRYLADARGLVEAGVDALVHSIRDSPVDAALIEAMRTGEVYYVPTLANHQAQFIYADEPAWLRETTIRETVDQVVIARLSGENYVSQKRQDLNLAMYRTEFDMAMRNLKALYDGGVRIGLGTDSGGEYYRLTGFFEHLELELMVEAGIPPAEVLRIGTEESAKILGIADSGTLVSGNRGDFLVVAGDPYQEISATRDIAEVFMGGVRLDRATMSARFQGFSR
jgi:imidazolonepropionase-like amidohydrolase